MANMLKNGNFGDALPAVVPGADYAYGWRLLPQPWETWNNSGPSPNCPNCSYTSTNIVKLSEIAQFLPPQPQCSGINDFLKNVPPDTEQVLQVCTNNVANGIVQVFTNLSPLELEVSLWVFVLRGQVQMGITTFVPPKHHRPPAQAIAGGITSSKSYQWERLQFKAHIKPGDTGTELFIYSSDTPESEHGAWFFAANASVAEI